MYAKMSNAQGILANEETTATISRGTLIWGPSIPTAKTRKR
jgi:hypothetical protein